MQTAATLLTESQTSQRPSWLSRVDRNPFVWGGAICLLLALYMAWIIHDTVNDIYFDDWTVVPLIDAALHNHLTLAQLWSQHGENRMLVPNLVMVGVGTASSDNTKVMVIISAVAFSAAFLVFLVLLRSYLGRSLTLVAVLSTGLVWFSLLDYFNALWDFQFAWYLIVLCFVGMLYFFFRRSRGLPALLGAMALAAIASYSSIQGLLLWIIGLLCLLWPLWSVRRSLERTHYVQLVAWVVAGAIATGIYFWNYAPTEIGRFGAVAVEPPTWALSHPARLGQFFLVDLGNVIPQTGLVLHELLGALLLAVAVLVFVQAARSRRGVQNLPLPLALISFGLLFDVAVATGRLSLGLGYAFKSQYTMPNLLVLLGVLCYGLERLDVIRSTPKTRPRAGVLLGLAALAVFLVLEVVTTTSFGLSGGEALRQQFATGARTTLIISQIPYSEWNKFEDYGVIPDVYESSNLRILIPIAKADHLGPLRESEG